ncbi:DNA-binding proteins Bright/BRCAA1/RBP1 and proteins containing BRIGHT domain [Podospora pseudopauciseta]|uniref:DNA-binding proteins Bright/BRCAA1/RBP1 and proteins containing BRIGHT domain n=2 Tax=Podospora TaxID=5144 RepID=A0ABR0H237_9PEZI|nr:DNA-binding proteins Bright/BRCAA1/RBP1 and proteins containing BRIGHT domain [Podospora pseudopauciseta]KAK4668656.1 DNA-binding proteins Bright/BRCAA1/RBP1 and proteins containing BRIGHT domain [Podospora pseudoanserina]
MACPRFLPLTLLLKIIASSICQIAQPTPLLPDKTRTVFPRSKSNKAAHINLLRSFEAARSNSTPKSVNMATMATAARDIATTSSPSPGRDNLTAVAAARSVPVTTHPNNLPTPPNSISPNLPPVGLRAHLMRAGVEPSVDSDLELHDRDAHDDEHSGPGSPPYDSAGAITSAMLANCHLPEILLGQGPLPIRHIMGYLTTTVPGFAGIPPAKARRLVVAALEGKGNGGVGSGPDGDVEFIKVGWGRWHAKRRGQGSRATAAAYDPPSRRTSPGGSSYPTSIPINKGGPGWHHLDRSRLAAMLGTSAGGASSAAFSHDDRLNEDRFMNMMDHEADKMSLDGSGSASCSEAPDEDFPMDRDDPEDATDDEDWAAVGAAALRASSYQAQSDNQRHLSPFNNVYSSSMRSFSGGMARPPQLNFKIPPSGLAGVMVADAQERDAVEALLQLGSV